MIQSGGYFHYADQQRPDGYFRTDITENAERTQNQVFVLPHAGFAVMAVFGYFLGDFTRVGQFDHFHEYGQQYQNAGQAQIRYLHRRNLFGLAGGLSGIGQNQHRTEPRRNRRTQRIERLYQRQRGRFLARPRQQGNVRVARHLQQGNAGSQNKQCGQKSRIRCAVGGRIKQQATDGGQQKPADNAALIADFTDQFAHRNRHHGISGKETELNQHCLNVRQVEDGFQMGNQNVV